MEERGLSVRALAEMASVSPSVVQSWLSKANPHDLRAVARLAKALNLSFKELLLGENEQVSVREATLVDVFEEHEFFEGVCRVTIRKLVPKKIEASPGTAKPDRSSKKS